MADKDEAQRHQGLICPLCLDALKNPTLLTCGHTFCKACLENYDEQLRGQDFMQCPVCKKRTKLGPHRVAGLSPNFLFKGIEEELHSKFDSSSNFCSLHSQVYKDILCEDCDEVICLTCFFEKHQGHKFRKKEEIEADLEKKRDALSHKSQVKKEQIEKSITKAEQDKRSIHYHLKNLEKEIKSSFARKVTLLQENEERLLKVVNDIRKDSDKIVDMCIGHQRKLIDNINTCLTISKVNARKCLDRDTLKAHHKKFEDLENSLEVSSLECSVRVRQTALKAEFCQANEQVLDLGHLEQGEKAIENNMCHLARDKNANIHAVTENNSLTIVRTAELSMSGMAALSRDTVVVGYGMSKDGSGCFSVSGEQKPHLNNEVGEVYDIAFLSDGRAVVSDGDTCFVYNPEEGQGKGTEFTCKRSQIFDDYMLCTDQHDNIYAINNNPEIYIYRDGNTNPQKVIPTGDMQPNRICVTKMGVMVITTIYPSPCRVVTYDKEGSLGSSIAARDDDDEGIEYLYAAVDSLDRVLVARIADDSNSFNLTRYTLQGTKLIEETVFKELELRYSPAESSISCDMVSLTPNLICFSCDELLYFIELPM